MKRVLIIAGETSGDLHGSALMHHMKKGLPDVSFKGIGGSLMIGEGLDAVRHVREMNFMGLTEVVRHLPFILRTLNDIEHLLDTWHPDLVILIDYPGFNLKLAPRAKKRGIPVMYYISPQLWAWHKSRVTLIQKYVDRMVVLFDFERQFYLKHGVNADFVGHPLLDAVQPSEEREIFREHIGAINKPLIGLLPGSRPQEIERILPAMAGSVNELRSRIGECTFVLGCAPELDREVYSNFIKTTDIVALEGKSYDIMAHADVLAVTSGTATLEAGISGTPMVIVYRTSRLTYGIGKALVDIPNIGLINVVAGSRIVPELWQNDVTPENISILLEKLLKDKQLHKKVKRLLNYSKGKLGVPGASGRAARIAHEMLSAKNNG